MKKLIVAILLFTTVVTAQAGEKEMRNDSILNEAKLLYRYEKATWIVSDLAYKSTLKNLIRQSITYASNDTIVVLYIDKDKQLMYEGKVDKEGRLISSGMRFKPLSSEESHLLFVRKHAIEQINRMHVVEAPSNVQLNLDLIPFNDGYKLYALSGTIIEDVVPFGNDYLFYTDKNGYITGWCKFHNGYQPTQSSQRTQLFIPEASYISEPRITATDICTFRLYADLYPQLKSFSVVLADGHNYKFDREQDRIMYSK